MWLVEHAAFIVGYLQTGQPLGSGNAIAALVPLVENRERYRGQAGEAVRHAALWGIGDIAGSVETVDQLEKGWIEELPGQGSSAEQRLVALVKECCSANETVAAVRRAGAYTATMLARRLPLNRAQQTRVSPVLATIVQDPDPLVRDLGRWGKKIEEQRRRGGYLAIMRLTPE